MFYLTKIENARMNVPEPEYLDVGSTAIEEGMTLALSAGKLVKEVAAPSFISAGNYTAGAMGVPVYRITKDMVFSVPVSAAPTSLKVGDKVTVNSDGVQVTATTTNGVATIVSLNGAKAAGDTIIVRF